jgi:PST family polysaccharide transporter
VSILLAAPGVIATLMLAQLVIPLFYSPKFQEALEVLRWLCLGMALRHIMADGLHHYRKRQAKSFLWSEWAWTVVYVALAWICVNAFGLNGAGIGFFGSYVFQVLMIYLVVRRVSGFQLTCSNAKTGLLLTSINAWVFGGSYECPIDGL